MNEITIIIKTFLRKKSLINLLNSIEKYYKNINIIIVDDGNICIEKELKKNRKLNIEYYKLPYDSGLSYGRNFGLSKVKTKYFLLCDDDFIFTEETKIENLKEILIEEDVDIVGGVIRNKYNYKDGGFYSRIKNLVKYLKNYKKEIEIYNYYGNILSFKTELIVEYYNKSSFENYVRTDICLNFFLGKTKEIIEAGAWNEKLKIGEHTAFFVKMKEAGKKVITTKQCICDHYPIRSKNYEKYRERTEEMTKILFQDRNLIRQISIFKEKNEKYIYYFENNKLIKKTEKL